jgi:hypothetical protein
MEPLLTTASRFWADATARPPGTAEGGEETASTDATASLLPGFLGSGPSQNGLAFLRVEVLRFASSSKLLVMARRPVDAGPPGDAPGWTRHQSPHATTFTRGAETVVVFPDGALEFSIRGGPIDRAAARASLESVPLLAPFVVLAGEDAEVMAWGTTRRFDGATTPFAAGLVKLEFATDPSIRALREAGFAPSDDDAIWVTAAGDHTVIWAGATVYGYVGHVPGCIGAWEDDPDEDDAEA